MGDSKKARQRQAKGQRSAIRQGSKPNKENVPAASPGPQSYPKPRPVNKKGPTVSNTNANDIEDAESAAINALTSLGQHRDNRTLHQTTAWDRAINQALGIGEEEADILHSGRSRKIRGKSHLGKTVTGSQRRTRELEDEALQIKYEVPFKGGTRQFWAKSFPVVVSQ
ncbi:hypothetical protein H0H92_007040 [Tricholoma furcatifolium]|nr:hypothetical protein H0H92_007040 [Tricholoma furcatifolium]